MDRTARTSTLPARLSAALPDLRDVLALAGLGLLATGVWMIYVPAALILVGLVLLAVSLFGVPRWES